MSPGYGASPGGVEKPLRSRWSNVCRPGEVVMSQEGKNTRDWSGHPMVVVVGVLAGLAAIVTVVAQVASGGEGDDDGVGTTAVTATTPNVTTPGGGDPGGGNVGSAVPGSSVARNESPTTAGGNEVTTASVTAASSTTIDTYAVDLDVALDTNTCSVVPGGGLQGGDVMTLLFRVASVGNVAYDGPVTATARSDTGLHGQSTGGMSRGPASSFVQVEFAGQDYGQTHTFTVTVEPSEDVEMVVGANDQATIIVSLPANRPAGTFDPCPS